MAEFSHPRCKILLMAKAPVAGQVKTRLQPQLSPQQSAQLHEALLAHCLAKLQRASLAPVQLCYAGEHPCWQQLQQRYQLALDLELVPQGGGDLGQRMAGMAQHTLAAGAETVVILGADCPFITGAYIEQAIQRLQQGAEVVFGPAHDGGYVLLAFRQLWPQLFADISWGSERVLAQSCRALGCRYHCLPPLADIDRPEDLPLLAALPALKHWAV